MEFVHRHRGVMMAQARSTASQPSRPPRDTVLYDGHCRFCRGQISILRRLDLTGRLEFTSLHDPRVPNAFPGLSREEMMEEMVVVDTRGREWRGAGAVRYLSRRLVALWPLALPLHVPGSMPLWSALYRLVARNRYRLAGSCADGACRLP